MHGDGRRRVAPTPFEQHIAAERKAASKEMPRALRGGECTKARRQSKRPCQRADRAEVVLADREGFLVAPDLRPGDRNDRVVHCHEHAEDQQEDQNARPGCGCCR